MVVLAVIASLLGGAAHGAHASQLIDRNARDVRLQVDAKGEAMITYLRDGKSAHVLAWGAVNANVPARGTSQVAFHLDYSGGYGKYRTLLYWKTEKWSCLPYDGPALAWVVTACRAPDGSYWALQSWQRELPDLGVASTVTQRSWELRLSHWTGELPTLSISLDWSYRRFDHLYGTLTYDGTGVYGFSSTSQGVPLDTFGRNIYLDTYDSAYGPGWKRENSFLTHGRGGSFCYGLYPHGDRPSGKGSKYRATVIGPGVTPDVMWQAPALGSYDAAADAAANADERQLADGACKVN